MIVFTYLDDWIIGTTYPSVANNVNKVVWNILWYHIQKYIYQLLSSIIKWLSYLRGIAKYCVHCLKFHDSIRVLSVWLI